MQHQLSCIHNCAQCNSQLEPWPAPALCCIDGPAWQARCGLRRCIACLPGMLLSASRETTARTADQAVCRTMRSIQAHTRTQVSAYPTERAPGACPRPSVRS